MRHSSTYFSIFEILSKNACLCLITRKQDGSRRLCFTLLKSELTENSTQYKANKLYNKFKEIGIWHVGIDQEHNKMLHCFYRDFLNLYSNDNKDISVFFK